jgi:hypothetical protein
MICIAEVDELLALFIDRKKGNIPTIVRSRILYFAGSLMWDDLERHAEPFGQRTAKGDGHPTVTVTVLDGELRRRRRGNRDSKPKLSGWHEFF